MKKEDLKWIRNVSELRDVRAGQWVNLAGDIGIYVEMRQVGMPIMNPSRACPVILNLDAQGRAEETTLYATKRGELKVVMSRMDCSDVPFGSVVISALSEKYRRLAEMAGVLE